MVSRQVYEGLVTPGINMEILPQLAESWETTAADTWIFNIRKGVKFHDGSDLTASDIAFSINRAKTAPSDMVDLIKSIKSASADADLMLLIKSTISDGAVFALLILKAMSLAVKSDPSWNFTPLRMLNIQVSAAVVSHDSAS